MLNLNNILESLSGGVLVVDLDGEITFFNQEAEDITLSTFTDLIQEMIDRGFVINFLEIHKGWMEIHNPEDIDLANNFL